MYGLLLEDRDVWVKTCGLLIKERNVWGITRGYKCVVITR